MEPILLQYNLISIISTMTLFLNEITFSDPRGEDFNIWIWKGHNSTLIKYSAQYYIPLHPG